MFTIKQGDDTMSEERQIYTEYLIIGGNGFVDGLLNYFFNCVTGFSDCKLHG